MSLETYCQSRRSEGCCIDRLSRHRFTGLGHRFASVALSCYPEPLYEGGYGDRFRCGCDAAAVSGTLLYGWSQWHSKAPEMLLAGWRLAVANFGVIAATLQAVFSVVLWTPAGHDRAFLLASPGIELTLLVLAVPCMLVVQGSRSVM